MLQALVGYAIIIVMMYLILTNKALPAFCFAILPVVGALAAGFAPKEILDFMNTGVGTTWKTAVLFIFSVVYFGIMNDAGMFDKMVAFLVKKAGNSIEMIMIATALIAVVGHIDGATAIEADATALWVSMIPMQIFGLILCLVMAFYFGKVERKRLAKEGIDLGAVMSEENQKEEKDSGLKRPKLYWFNIILTVILIALLIEGTIPTFLVFMFGMLIAMAVNYPDMKLQNQRMMAHAPNCIGLTITLLCAGVFLGIFANSGIIASMAQVLIDILPAFLRKYLHIIVGILGAPMGIVMGPDPYYYGVMPLIIETIKPLGVSAEQVARAMLIGENVALAVSPCVATTFLAIGMAGVDLKDHMKFSFKYMWAVSVVMLVFAMITGMV